MGGWALFHTTQTTGPVARYWSLLFPIVAPKSKSLSPPLKSPMSPDCATHMLWPFTSPRELFPLKDVKSWLIVLCCSHKQDPPPFQPPFPPVRILSPAPVLALIPMILPLTLTLSKAAIPSSYQLKASFSKTLPSSASSPAVLGPHLVLSFTDLTTFVPCS